MPATAATCAPSPPRPRSSISRPPGKATSWLRKRRNGPLSAAPASTTYRFAPRTAAPSPSSPASRGASGRRSWRLDRHCEERRNEAIRIGRRRSTGLLRCARNDERDTMTHAYICDAVRTPIGRYGGALAHVRADDLAAIPIRALTERNPDVDWDEV